MPNALELKAALRSLARRPTFTVAVVLTLALGIGATTAVFSVVDQVVLRPLPYPQPDELVAVWGTTEGGSRLRSASPADFLDWQRGTDELGAMAGWNRMSATLAGSSAVPVRPEQVTFASVTDGFFDVLGSGASVGRLFSAGDGPGAGVGSGGTAEAVVSHGLWTRAFGADPGVVGRTVRLDGDAVTVVGVAPAHLDFPEGTEVWVRAPRGVPEVPFPYPGDLRATRDSWYFGVVARLAPGSSLEAAAAEMDALAAGLSRAHPETNAGTGIRLVPLLDDRVGDHRATLFLLFGAVGLVLLVASANVAGLLLVRAAGRGHELALRAALGARRRHLLERTLAEGLLLAVAGGGLGVALAALGVPLLGSGLAAGLPRTEALGVDGRVILFSAAATVGALLLAGGLPALAASGARAGARATGALASTRGAVGRGGGWLRSGLVAAEVALALALTAGAALLVRSAGELASVEPGFRAEGLLTVRVGLPDGGGDDRAVVAGRWRRIVEAVEAVPGVRAAAVAQAGPASDGWRAGLKTDGGAVEDDEIDAAWQVVGEGYFEAAGIPLLAGRAFGSDDGAGAEKVAVVSESLARRVWPGESAVGRRLRVGMDGEGWVRVVGVVGDTRNRGLAADPVPAEYRPLAQPAPWPAAEGMLLVRHDGVAGLAAAVRRAVEGAEPDAPVFAVRTGADLLGASTARTRLVLSLLGAFAALALVLGAVGIYGVAASTVAERTREIGVRMALGADRASVVGLVLRRGLGVVAVGLAAGAAIALAGGRFLEGLLFRVEPADPWALAAAAGVLAVVAVVAVVAPARRAALLPPSEALRRD